ncbi:hypothetical protein C8J57DRAFT_1627132, partial [Mycena rebaudengoi]
YLLACIQDFILRHNLLVGTYNSTGERYQGHDCIWLTNQTGSRPGAYSATTVPPNWVNGNLYVRTSEVSGVLTIPPTVRAASGMGIYNPLTDWQQRHKFLASRQGTRKPVLPVHTPEERDLFSRLMATESAFNSRAAGPNWKEVVKIWNRRAEYYIKDEVSYKVLEQLSGYYAEWKTNIDVRQSLSVTAPVRRPVLASLRDPQRSLVAPNVLQWPAQTQVIVSKGLLPLLTLSQIPPSSPTTAEHNQPPQLVASTSTSLSSSEAPSLWSQMNQLFRKRAAEAIPGPARKKQRKPRTCAKCPIQDCKGKKESEYCKDAFRDCGSISCKGRNSKAPQKRCSVAWD